MIRNEYPALSQFLGGYLHQDFTDEFGTATDAVKAFALGEPFDFVRSAADEITSLLIDERFCRSPGSVLLSLGCYYDPQSENMPFSEWLQRVQRLLVEN